MQEANSKVSQRSSKDWQSMPNAASSYPGDEPEIPSSYSLDWKKENMVVEETLVL